MLVAAHASAGDTLTAWPVDWPEESAPRLARAALCSAPPFIVYALPRSRTAWIAAFLSYGDWVCRHEQAVEMREIADIPAFFAQPCTGTVETAAAQGHWLFRHYAPPGLRVAVVHRPVDEVVASVLSMNIAGIRYDEAKLQRNMDYGARMLRQIAGLPGVLSVDFGDLRREVTCAKLFEHLLHLGFDFRWWSALRRRNLQVDVRAALSSYLANRDAVERFKRLCFSELLALRRSGSIGR